MKNCNPHRLHYFYHVGAGNHSKQTARDGGVYWGEREAGATLFQQGSQEPLDQGGTDSRQGRRCEKFVALQPRAGVGYLSRAIIDSDVLSKRGNNVLHSQVPDSRLEV